MELHDSWENRITRRVIIDRNEVAVSWVSRAIDIQNQTLLLSFFFKVLYLPPLYSSCLPAPATAAPESATPALALPALYVIAFLLRVL
ncbi:hypothetical protein N7527_010859 [Penicillium freii]|uniref:Uncharacterized protein n=1 Tax=Penicillium freii TaxID=48697 RepID=A0A101MKD1_PENFR|nr:hypothetical protein N7527_010859 [Penicillium freii]KUM62171.1 hypothetical protein ACN42_g4932 [Penicillium freii]